MKRRGRSGNTSSRWPWTTTELMELADAYNAGKSIRAITEQCRPHSPQSVAKQITELRREGKLIARSYRMSLLRRLQAYEETEAIGSYSNPMEGIRFADDPRAKQDHGSSKFDLVKPLNFSPNPSSAAF